MNNEKIDKIDSIITLILSEAKNKSIDISRYIHIELIIEKLFNLKINFANLNEIFLQNVEGSMDFSKNIIWIDESRYNNLNDQTSNRYRFTLAHELGHYVLHKQLYNQNKNRKFNFSNFQNEKIEQEANQFAAAILMPKESIVERYKKVKFLMINNENKIINTLSQEFQVSKDSLKYRLQNLNLI